MFLKPQHVHFVGIGGIGMSGIAEVLLSLGYQVSGSDLRASAITDRLAQLGAKIYSGGHVASNVIGAKAVVVTSALDQTNPEVEEARRLQIPIIPRGEMLAELMRLKFGIAIAGSHGKTTTTSMAATILNGAGLDPTVVVGGRVAAMGGSNARIGKSQLLIVESDESDGSFLKLAPIIAVVTNIDREHLDHYANIEEIRSAFTEFVNKVPFYGAAVLCMEDPNIQKIFPAVRRRTITYGRTAQVDLQISDVQLSPGGSDFSVHRRGTDLGRFHLGVPGIHNVLNATAALGVGLEMDLQPDQIREGLAQFSGVDRRFTVRGIENGITVVDDYGHHPTEVKATLAAARLSDYRKIRVLFQPHRFTRTKHLLDEFGTAFHQADDVYLLDIYAASEHEIQGVSGAALAEKVRSYGHRSVHFVPTLAEGVAAIASAAEPGDLIITLGAGSVSQAADQILSRLKGAANGSAA
jgi:UDP-N-acetylmuramate--alanine ligase